MPQPCHIGRTTAVNNSVPESRCAGELGWLYSQSDLGILAADHIRPYKAVVAGLQRGHDLSMDEYAWPTGPNVPTADVVLRSWAATVAALPVGARVAGEVIGRQPFGVFICLDGVPNAVALAEIAAMPHGMELPALGARVEGEVLWHSHDHQVRLRLDE